MEEKIVLSVQKAVLRAHFGPLVRQHFGGLGESVLRMGLAEGFFVLADNGEPGVAGPEGVVTRAEGVVAELRSKFSDLALPLTARKPTGKTMTSSELNALSTNPANAQKLSDFFLKDHGQIVPDRTDGELAE